MAFDEHWELHDITVDAMNQYQSASFLRSLQRVVSQAANLSQSVGSKFEQRAQLGALHAATSDRPGQECNSHRATSLSRWLAAGIIASRCCYSWTLHAQFSKILCCRVTFVSRTSLQQPSSSQINGKKLPFIPFHFATTRAM